MKNQYITTLIAFYFLLSFPKSIYGQVNSFIKTYGGTGNEFGHAMACTPDGGYILTGQTQSYGDTCGDIYIVKVNTLGIEEWTKVIAGNKLEGGNSIVCARDGGYFITCHTESYGSGECDSWAIKTDEKGNVLWSQLYGGIGDDVGEQGIETFDGAFIICGVERSLNTTGNAFLVKYSESGDLLWNNTYGGTDAEIGYRIIESPDHGYVVSGVTTSNSSGPVDVLVFKTDKDGNLLWSKNIGGTDIDEGYGITASNDGGFIISGFTRSFGAGDEDAYIIKIDDSGKQLWSRNYGGLFSDKLFSVTNASDGGYIFAGETKSFTDSLSILLIKTDMFGNQVWMKTFGGALQTAAWIVSCPDGGYAIAGTEYKTDGKHTDLLLVKTDKEGNVSTGIPGIPEPQFFTVSPNPSQKFINISMPKQNQSYDISIFSAFGNKVVAAHNQTSIDVSELAKGLYFIYLIDNNHLLSSKFIKE